jgi:hypothetical protein
MGTLKRFVPQSNVSWSAGVMEKWSVGGYEIPNSKHQITNKSQIPISNDLNKFGILNFGHCYLFVICDL